MFHEAVSKDYGNAPPNWVTDHGSVSLPWAGLAHRERKQIWRDWQDGVQTYWGHFE